MSVTTVHESPERRLLIAAGVGAAVALSLGIYGSVHDPASDLSITLGFADTITMKVWLTTIAVLFALVQIFSALWMYGRLPFESRPSWLANAHRISGRIAFLFTLPVAYHCLWALGFKDTGTRQVVHGLLGCAFYGAFTTKMLLLRVDRLPRFTLPIAGGLLVSLLTGLWFTSSWWFFTNVGFPGL